MKAKILLLICIVFIIANVHGAVVEFSTYLGGTESDMGSAMAIAPDGGIVFVLNSQSSSLAGVTPSMLGPSGSSDIAVCKLSADGSTVEFLTFIGGSSSDAGYSVAIAPDGSIWVSGYTTSSDFPLVNPIRSIYQNYEGVLFKLASDGSALLFSTFFGGNGSDSSSDIETDSDGNVYFAGKTTSSDLPLLNEFQISPGDCFVGAMAPDGSLLFCSYLGEYNGPWDVHSAIYDIALDAQANILVCGTTRSTIFPIHNAWQTTFNGSFDAYLMKISRSDWSLEFSTYLGGVGDDRCYGVASDSDSNIYMVGQAQSTDFPLVNALDSYYSNPEGFICRFTSDGQTLDFSSFVGGYGSDILSHITVNSNDEAMVVGVLDRFTSTAYYGWEYKASPEYQVFYARLASDVSSWVDMAALGGGFVADIAEGRNGDAIICGTAQESFPCLNALQPINAGGGYDGFIARLSTNTVRCIPFIEDFEYGRMDSKWINLIEARTVALGTAHSGDTELRFSPRTASQVYTAEVVLDLKGRSGIVFSFWCRSSSPERFSDVLPETFTGSGNGSGVAFSVDGNTWYRLTSLTLDSGLSTDYKQYTVDLDAALAAAGLSYDSPLHFKFHIKQNTYDPGTYLYIDDISVVGTILNFQQDTVSIIEGSQGTFSVVRTGANEAACSVDYVTLPNTAQPNINYITTTGTLSFAEGQFTNTFTVETIDNGIENIRHSFAVKLQNPIGVEVGIPNVCTVFITDDDESLVFPVRCGFESGEFNPIWNIYTEEEGLVEINSNFTPPDGDNLAHLACSGMYNDGGLAELTLPIDLAGLSNLSLSFYASRTSFGGGDNADMIMPLSYTGHGRYVGVSISADGNTWYKLVGLSTLEGVGHDMQRFEISLDSLMTSYGLSYTDSMYIRFSMGNTDIMNPTWLQIDLVEIYSLCFDFETSSKTCVEYDGTQAFTVLRKGQTDNTASVQYSTRNGSAVNGEDFVDITGTLNFAAGQATNTINIDIQNDDASESDEVFYVDLLSPSTGFVIGNNGTVHVNIKDDDNYSELPFQDYFEYGSDFSDWVAFGEVYIKYHWTDYTLSLDVDQVDSYPSAVMLPINPNGKTNIVLSFKAEYYPYSHAFMPDIYTGLDGGGDGVAISEDGVTWYKLIGFSDNSEWDDWNETEVTLDPFLNAVGIIPGEPFKLRFEAHSTWRLYLDDVIVYSRMPLEISPKVLPNATGMVAYATELICSNAIIPVVWREVDGLPNGLELSESGVISGVPTAEGVFTPAFSIMDSFGGCGTGIVSLVVEENTNRPPSLTLKSPADETVPMFEQTNKIFTLEAVDPEGVPLTYTWEVDGTPVSSQPTNYLHNTVWGDAGTYQLEVRVSDGLWNNVLASWTLQVSADNDGDGMPNDWERTYGLNPWDAADAGLDADGDYLTNLQEFQKGTSPTNSDSNGDSLGDGWQDLYGQDPLQPRGMASLSLERLGAVGGFDNAQAVAAYGDAVYLADGLDGWKVFDASTPENPVLVNSYGTQAFAYDCTVEGDRLYLADGTNGLMKVPLDSDPLTLAYSQKYVYSPVRVVKSTVVDQTAYVSTYDAVDNFHILDVTDGLPSPFLGDLNTFNSIRDVAIQGDLAYVAGGDGEFSIIDVSDPETPFARGHLDIAVGHQGSSVVVTGTVAYLTSSHVGVYVADVSNPDAPVWTRTNAFVAAAAPEMIARDGFIFLALNGDGFYADGGLYAFDVTNSDWSVSITNILTMDYIQDICVTTNRLYVVDNEQGLVVFDYASDYDQDGLLDDWERRLLGSLAYGADEDLDGDGITNLGEQRAGTNPQNSDSDSDGMNDGWEVFHMMNPDNPADAFDNFDSDPHNNSEEFIADTDPTDSNDWFRVTAFSNLPPMMVYFYSSSNRLYTLLGCTNLVVGEWVPLVGPRVGVGGADCMTNDSVDKKFLKLKVEN
ncbi:MAG: SBBP repeat-containing protein [Kiritimatiellae bacterium]|nr:SBBP repeat-containing protein [Kiritimatiellia bacterium]